MPKKNNKPGLFSCISSQDVGEEVLAPLKLTDEQIQILKEVIEQISFLENLPEKTNKQQHLLLLMRTIKRFSEKEQKFHDESAVLNGMIEMYIEKKIDWSQYETPTASSLNSDKPEQNRDSSLLKQLNAVKLRPVAENLNGSTQAFINKNIFPDFLVNPKKLDGVKLKKVNFDNNALKQDPPSELEKAFAKRKANLKKGKTDITNIASVTRKESLSGSDSEDDFDFLERVCNAPELPSNEPNNSIRFINALSRIYEDQIRPSSTMNDLNSLLENIQQFIDEQENKNTLSQLQQGINNFFRKKNRTNKEAFQSLNSNNSVNNSTYFKNSSLTNEDKPIIVATTLKL